MQAKTPNETRGRLGSILTFSGAATLIATVVLYVSGISRAIAVWIAPVGIAATIMGVALLRGAKLPRWALVALAAVVIALAVLGIATWIYSAAHPPTAV